MNHLKSALTALQTNLPGLFENLQRIPFAEMEKQGNPALQSFREAGGPALLIPKSFGGRGASPLDAVRVHRALGFLSPSLSIAATMHNFSVASLVEMAQTPASIVHSLLEQIAGANLYVASGVAEGRTGASTLSSNLQVRSGANGLVLNGSKKPCCLSESMDLLTASLQMPANGPHAGELAFAIIPAQTPGIERKPFWQSPVLAGAESDEVILKNVEVAAELISFLDPEGRLLAGGFLWFELLIAASYLGITDGLVAAVFTRKKGSAADRAVLGIEHESAMASLEAVAYEVASPNPSPELLGRCLSVRYAAQRSIERTSALAAEVLGGLAFITEPEYALRQAASRMLAFHPPSRLANSAALDDFFLGGPLILN